VYGSDDLGLSGTPRPSARKLPSFRVNVFESGSFHFVETPGYGSCSFRRTSHTGSDIVAKLAEIFVGVGLHHSGAGNGAQRFEHSVIKTDGIICCG
jgi:hypothetical protein